MAPRAAAGDLDDARNDHGRGAPATGIPRGGGRMSGEDPQARETARRKLIGRLAVIAFVALVAAYVAVTFRWI
jgi:hypothetical protein